MVLLSVSGIAMMLYPWWDRYMQEKQRLSMLEQWNSLRVLSAAHEPTKVSLDLSAADFTAMQEEEPSPRQEETEEPVNIDGFAVRGMMTIEKLDLKEPIVEGADPEALKTGIGIVEPERSPGMLGNFVVAGHRSWTYGKQFSRLNELEAGDSIAVDTTKHSYKYTVTSKFLVKPDDLSVLEQKKDKAEMTLITCEPKYNPTHRLIVKARLES